MRNTPVPPVAMTEAMVHPAAARQGLGSAEAPPYMAMSTTLAMQVAVQGMFSVQAVAAVRGRQAKLFQVQRQARAVTALNAISSARTSGMVVAVRDSAKGRESPAARAAADRASRTAVPHQLLKLGKTVLAAVDAVARRAVTAWCLSVPL